ncbi:hypothetical protein K0M31_010115, partial [Melipona bicolor]
EAQGSKKGINRRIRQIDDEDFAGGGSVPTPIGPVSLFAEASSRDTDHPWISTRRRNE